MQRVGESHRHVEHQQPGRSPVPSTAPPIRPPTINASASSSAGSRAEIAARDQPEALGGMGAIGLEVAEIVDQVGARGDAAEGDEAGHDLHRRRPGRRTCGRAAAARTAAGSSTTGAGEAPGSSPARNASAAGNSRSIGGPRRSAARCVAGDAPTDDDGGRSPPDGDVVLAAAGIGEAVGKALLQMVQLGVAAQLDAVLRTAGRAEDAEPRRHGVGDRLHRRGGEMQLAPAGPLALQVFEEISPEGQRLGVDVSQSRQMLGHGAAALGERCKNAEEVRRPAQQRRDHGLPRCCSALLRVPSSSTTSGHDQRSLNLSPPHGAIALPATLHSRCGILVQTTTRYHAGGEPPLYRVGTGRSPE